MVDFTQKMAENGILANFENQAVWLIRNKIDIANSDYGNDQSSALLNTKYHISAITGQGVNDLVSALAKHASQYFGIEPAVVSRERHRKALEAAQDALDRALIEDSGGREDIIAEELRLAARALGRLTGRVDVEDILDVIFRDFCIGK
jgi:tRNA modification GTPase